MRSSIVPLFALLALATRSCDAQRTPAVTAARCVLRGTPANGAALTGTIDVTAEGDGTLLFRYSVAGLSDGDHGIHVHTLGDLSAADATATGGHYVGSCTDCRPQGSPEQTVGWIGDGAAVVSAGGQADGEIRDSVAKLGGVDSIVGRSLVIHGNADGAAPRVAQCVIGAVGAREPDVGAPVDATALPSRPIAAQCEFTGLSVGGSAAVTGSVTFEERPGFGDVVVAWDVQGLGGTSWAFHVHQSGDVSTADASGTLGHFVGVCDGCRPDGALAEVGNLNDGARWTTASGSYVDKSVELRGYNSIVGRSVVIHGDAGDDGKRVAQCVIGISDELPLPPVPNVPQNAVCRLKATPANADQGLDGEIHFHPNVDGTLHIHYEITGLSAGDHTWHVHTLGDVSSADATATGGHFKGNCGDNCRPGAGEQTVGYLADGAPINSDGSTPSRAVGDFDDKVAKLSGAASIIGRSIVIHGNAGDAGARVAQCVIGVDGANEPVTASPAADDGRAELGTQVTGANCVFEGANGAAVTGTATLSLVAPAAGCGPGNELALTLSVAGLAPGAHTAHIHQAGNVASADATATLGHFVGDCVGCRAPGTLPEVGSFNDGKPFDADAAGAARVTFVDASMKLSGYNSVLGRSIVIHGDGTTPGTRVAQCVIGTTAEAAPLPAPPACPTPSAAASATPAPSSGSARSRATCHFEGTIANGAGPNGIGAKPVTGTMTFTARDDAATSFDVAYDISGLSDGSHTFHVHTFGDLTDPVAAMATAGHFVGDCNNCRGQGAIEQTVGLLGGGTHTILSTASRASASFTDSVIRLRGTNSILGRSIVIHGNSQSSGARVAQCVVGLVDANDPGTESDDATLLTTEARCELRPPPENVANYASDPTAAPSGSVLLEYDPDTHSTRLLYTMRNLPEGANAWHVHQAGNMASAQSTLGHFVGGCDATDPPCRPDGVLAEAAMLGDGLPVQVTSFGAASGDLRDSVIALNGPQSIVGRSIVVHAPGGERVLQCVIGRTSERTRQPSRPRVSRAKCLLRATRYFTGGVAAASGKGYDDLQLGYLDISERSAADGGGLQYRYFIEGLSDGKHQFHVHDWGNVLAEDAAATGGHFLGRCGGNCRPEGVKQEVGLLQDGKDIVVSNAISEGVFVDTVTRLNGPNSIVGRSIVIHGNTTSASARVAMCVVGVAEANEPETPRYYAEEEPPAVTEAMCHFRPALPNAPDDASRRVTGTVRFRSGGGHAGVTFDYYISQLPPGAHTWHVHQAGDISAADASATLGHFVGDCPDCRSQALDEVGEFTDGVPLLADARGVALGSSSDGVASLNGVNSIIGRSLVIHGDGTEAGKGTRIAQCVIGITDSFVASADAAAYAAQAATFAERDLLEGEVEQAKQDAEDSKSGSKGTVAGLAIATGVFAIAAVGAVAFAIQAKKKGPAGANRV